MKCRQLRQLNMLAVEQRRGADKESILTVLCYRGERGSDVATAAGVENFYLKPNGAAGRLDVADRNSVFAASAGSTSTATRLACGTSSCRSASRFGVSS